MADQVVPTGFTPHSQKALEREREGLVKHHLWLVDLAIAWAKLMEAELSKGVPIRDSAHRSLHQTIIGENHFPMGDKVAMVLILGRIWKPEYARALTIWREDRLD